jgi:hypothetical protein
MRRIGLAVLLMGLTGCSLFGSPTVGGTGSEYPGWAPRATTPEPTQGEVEATYRPLLDAVMPLAASTLRITWRTVTVAKTGIAGGCGYSVSALGSGGARTSADYVGFQPTIDPILAGRGFAATKVAENQGGQTVLTSVDGSNAYLSMRGRGIDTTIEVLVYLHDGSC